MRIQRTLLSFALALLTSGMLWIAPAAAKPRRAATKIDKDDTGYIYTFEDDIMDGTAGGSFTPRIRVYPRGMRRTLIRPRLSFVPELLRSVEGI